MLHDARDDTSRNHRRLLKLFERDGDWCAWCGDPIRTHRQILARKAEGKDTSRWKEATIDHLIPRREGGTSELENLVAACATCNIARGASPDRFPARPPFKGKHPEQERGREREKIRQAPRIEPDHDAVIALVAWKRAPEQPVRPGLYLVTKPGTWRVRLFPVGMTSEGPVVVQAEKTLVWPVDLWFSRLEDLLQK